jgi:N-acetylmuramoyl-L-alanine amidase
MKKITLILIVLLFSFLFFDYTYLVFHPLPLIGHTIFIDPGHGGRDPGAIYFNIKEKDINLEISKILKEELEKEGAIVYMTREEDIDYSDKYATRKKKSDLYNRAQLINSSNYEILLQIHLNSYPSSKWWGAQVIYGDEKSKSLAEVVQKSFQKHLNSPRDIQFNNNYYLMQNVNMPTIIIEAGFLTNPDERYLLQQKSYQERIAKAIVIALKEYFTKR